MVALTGMHGIMQLSPRVFYAAAQMQPPRCCWHRIQHYRTPQGFALLRSSTDTIPLLTTGMAKVLPYHHDGEVDVNHVGDISRSATAEHFVLPPRPEKGGTYSPVISPAYSINNDFDSFSDTDQPANFTTSADDVDDIAELEMSRDAQELPKTAHLDSQNPSFVEPKVNTEHRGRSRHRQIATLSGLTSTGRVRKGTRGKPHHGCVFCGKVNLTTPSFGQDFCLLALGLYSSRTLEVVYVCYYTFSTY